MNSSFAENKTWRAPAMAVSIAPALPKPQVGRKLWLWGAPGTVRALAQPFDASIAFVESAQPGDECVTVHYRDHTGAMLTARGVPLVAPTPSKGNSLHGVDDMHAGTGRSRIYATWTPAQMPRQNAGSAA